MKNISKLKVAIVHDFFYWYGGAELVVKALCEAFPNHVVYTGFVAKSYKGWLPQNLVTLGVEKKLIIKVLRPFFTLASKVAFRNLKITSDDYVLLSEFLLPFAFEDLTLNKYDLVISSSSSFAKGIIHDNHIAYIHTTPRFLWGLPTSRQKKLNKIFATVAKIGNFNLRVWDFYAAQRPKVIIANSQEVQNRIYKYYKRKSTIIYPPHTIEKTNARYKKKNYFLVLSRLEKYKKVDEIIKAFNMYVQKGEKSMLYIAGTGGDETRLKALARKNNKIKFLGFVTEKKKLKLLSEAKCLIYPQLEDFGITPLEAMACGTPVIGLNQGGTKETVIHNKTGILIESSTSKDIYHALVQFDEAKYKASDCKKQAQKFSKPNFIKKIQKVAETLLN